MSSPEDRPLDAEGVVHRLEFDIDWPPGYVAAYLLDVEEPVLVDAGQPGSAAERTLREGLDRRGYDLSDIEHLILTHGHPDHTGQTPTIVEVAEPTLYAPKLVLDRLDRDIPSLRVAVRSNTTAAGTAPEKLDTAIEWAVRDIEFSRSLLPPGSIDVAVEAGEPFEAGGITFDPVHTPGHNAEHLVYFAGLDADLAFSGDMVVQNFRAVLMHRGLDNGVREAVPAFQRGLSRLEARSVDRVFPGHGPAHSQYESALEQSQASLVNLLDTTWEYLSNYDTAVEITRARMGDSDSRSLGYMLPETVAALAHLERTGRATGNTDPDGVRRYDQR